MKRETTNAIRFVIEELLPPALRDSRAFRFVARLAWGAHIDVLSRFRREAASLTAADYVSLYQAHPRVHADTDNSQDCVAAIADDLLGGSLLDVGCGTGHLLRAVTAGRQAALESVVGLDFIIPEGLDTTGFDFVLGRVERLPFEDAAFDTVVCTHVLEHILDIRRAIAELRRVARRRLIIVVPCEREALVTFNPHLHFFPYTHSFLRAMIPLPRRHACQRVGRDIYYVEDLVAPTMPVAPAVSAPVRTRIPAHV